MKAEYLNTYYNQEWVYKNIRTYFGTKDFFEPIMIKKYGVDQLWSFLDFRMLSNLLYIRVTRDIPITVNTGSLTQRGYRSILSQIVKDKVASNSLYTSAHLLGNGVDFGEKGIIAEDTRIWIEANTDHLPYKCRLEWKKNGVPITWVHMDTNYFPSNPKVYKFDV